MQAHLSPHIADISAADWQAISGNQPFISHAFLSGMEATGCATAETGWTPQILSLRDNSTLHAAVPMYAKTHSMGEFVFDWSWADAYAQNNVAYYPKLVIASPFSPAQGPRLLANTPEHQTALLDAVLTHAAASNYSSLHILFPSPDEVPLLESRGLLIRQGVQFHWQNNGYKDFDDFLAALTREKRKKIKQERRKVADAGITLRQLTGAALTPALMDFVFVCYRNTYAVRGREPYLNRAFFHHLAQSMPDQVLVVVAELDGHALAMALNLYQDDTLWGRYWGCVEHISCLHFEVCYYQAIEFCIARGIQCFEGGAQGEHKLARGFMPVTTYSAHWLAHPAFRDAVGHFLKRETNGIEHYMDELNEHAPFK